MNKHPFEDITDFHVKYGFEQPDAPAFIEAANLKTRLNFLLEELNETAKAAGYTLQPVEKDGEVYLEYARDEEEIPDSELSLVEFLDGLVDLNYVSYGTAWLCRLNLPEAWNRVHAANMTKIRCERAEDSKRGTTFDVIKPKDFVRPDLSDLV